MRTRTGTRVAVYTCAAAVALIAAAPAGADTKVYGGTTDIGGAVAMDVKLSKSGVPKRITELRAHNLPVTCSMTGTNVADLKTPVNLKVDKKGRFAFHVTDNYGNESRIGGRFGGQSYNRVRGDFVFAAHYPPQGLDPEENCSSEFTDFTLKKGGPDAVPSS